MKLTFLLLFLLIPPREEISGCLEMDIIILCDLSGSVEGKEQFITEAVTTFVDKIDISETGIRVGVMGFNEIPFIVSGLNGNKEEIKHLVEDYPFSGEGLTYMSTGLQVAFNELSRDRPGVQKLIILISDGAASDEDDAMTVVDQLKFVNVGICGVLIRNASSDSDFMKKISNGCYVESSYESLVVELAKMDICL